MFGNMSQEPLLISGILNHAEQFNADVSIFSRVKDGSIKQSNWGQIASRAKQVANGLQGLGLKPGDRVATLSWNEIDHLEVYFGISCSGLVLHTINPRLFADQIVYIANHGGAKVIILDIDFLPVIEEIAPLLTEVEHFILFDTKGHASDSTLPNLQYYEEFRDQNDADFHWPLIDENSASSLCYTSGTTGNPKGVMYSHRSTVIHSMSATATKCHEYQQNVCDSPSGTHVSCECMGCSLCRCNEWCHSGTSRSSNGWGFTVGTHSKIQCDRDARCAYRLAEFAQLRR